MNATEYLNRYFEDSLDEEEKGELIVALRDDPEFAKAFLETAFETAEIIEMASRLDQLSIVETQKKRETPRKVVRIPLKDPATVRRRPVRVLRPTRLLQLSIAASLALMVPIVVHLIHPAKPRPIAQLHLEEGARLRWFRNGDLLDPRSQTQLQTGDRLELLEGSASVQYLSDETRLALRSGTRVSFKKSTGKLVRLSAGTLITEVSPQPVGRPMLIQTDEMILRVLGTVFSIQAELGQTEIAVHEGAVEIERALDQATIQIPQGSFAIVRETGEKLIVGEFLMGVNFGGDACVIEGNLWLSEEDAYSRGMKLDSRTGHYRKFRSYGPPAGVDERSDLARMLMFNVASTRTDGTLYISQPLPDGRYQVFLWIMEINRMEKDFLRSADLMLENNVVETSMGSKHGYLDWDRFGPYDVLITDGELNLNLQAERGPIVSGLAIYRAADSSPNK